MRKSSSVPKARIEAILVGGDAHCKPHEAITALRTCASIPNGIEGEQAVRLGERPLRHYICGEGRKNGGKPDVVRLRTLPCALQAVRKPESWRHELEQAVITTSLCPEGHKPFTRPKGVRPLHSPTALF